MHLPFGHDENRSSEFEQFVKLVFVEYSATQRDVSAVTKQYMQFDAGETGASAQQIGCDALKLVQPNKTSQNLSKNK